MSLSSVDSLHAETTATWRAIQAKLGPLSAKLDAHRKALIATIETGTQLVEAFDALLSAVPSGVASTSPTNDASPLASFNDDACRSLHTLGRFVKDAEIKRQQAIVAWSEKLVPGVKQALDEPNRQFEAFEKQCQASNKAQEQHEARLQKAAKSAAKAPADLKDALAAVSDAVVAVEQTRTAQLRELLAMQRRRHCELLAHFLPWIEALQQQAACTQLFAQTQLRDLRTLATPAGAAAAAAAHAEFRVTRERTLIPLHNTDATRDLPPGVIGVVRALWDADAEEPGDLEFKRSDTIYVLAKDHESGWWTGTLQGRTGLFPAVWVIDKS